MNLSILRLSLTIAAVTVVLASAGLHHLRQIRLSEVARLRDENDRLRLKISQQRQARLAKSGIPEQQAKVGVISDAPSAGISGVERPAAPAAEISRVPGTEYRHEGQATPIAALQTYAWVCDHGEATAMLNMIHFDEVARTKTKSYWTGLPPEMRAQWPTIEVMAAALLIDDGMQHPYPGAAILALARTEVISEERVVFRLPGTGRDHTEFQKTAEGWKYAITEKMVDDYIAETNAEAQAARRK